MRFQIVISALFICLLPFGAVHAQSKKAPQVVAKPADGGNLKTIVLEQHSDALGHVLTYVSNEAVRIVVQGSNVSLVARAPEWRVVFFNGLNNKAVVMTFQQWLKHKLQTTYAYSDYDRFELAMVDSKDVSRFGRSFKQVASGRVVNVKALDKKADYLYMPVPNIPRQACLIVEKSLNCPGASGLPIDLWFDDKRQFKMEAFTRKTAGAHTYLHTSGISEKQSPRAFFAYPGKTIAVSREADVINDESQKNKVEEAVKDFL